VQVSLVIFYKVFVVKCTVILILAGSTESGWTAAAHCQPQMSGK